MSGAPEVGSSPPWAALRARFEELVELAPAEQEQRLTALENEEPRLGRELRRWLAADVAAGLLDRPAVDAAAELLFTESGAESGTATGGADLAGLRLGAWRLVERLGEGGMGEVWLAARADGGFEQQAAIKLIKRGMDSEEVLRRFRRERQILARLEHPRIAHLLDGGMAPDGRPYFVLERVRGATILEWARRGKLGVEARIELVLQAAEGVEFAHRNLVVHRDLKPSNILVGEDGQVKLLDFGIAKLLDPGEDADATRTAAQMLTPLTPRYAAPEQILGEPATTATDVYALGAVLYELLAGELPHRPAASSSLDLSRAAAHETIDRPSVVAARTGRTLGWARRLSGDLDTIVLRALAREADRRYPSVATFAEDLRRHLDGRPVLARADTRGYRLSKFVRRHRLAVVAAAAVIGALVVGLSMALWQARRAEKSASMALAQVARAERVRGFLISVFDAADPARTLGEKIEARTLVDEGVRRADAELTGAPELRAEMRDVFAGLYRKLGDLASAKALAEKALGERSRIFGSESVEAAKSEWTLGWVLSNQGEFAPARQRLKHSIAVLESAEGPLSLAAADAREPLMELLFGAEGPAAALPVVERRLATYRAVLGERHEKTALSLSDLGVVLNEVKRVDDAERAYRASAQILDALLPADDPRRAYPHSNLAGLLRENGRLEDAEREARVALAIRRKSLGSRHPETGLTLSQLGRVLLDLGRLDEAEAAARESLAICEGRDRFAATQARSNVASVLLRKGRAAEALALFDQVLAEQLALLPEEHLLVYSVRVNRLRALQALGRVEEARAGVDALVVRLESKGVEHAAVLADARALAVSLDGKPIP
ncbi:MAG: tetratricopeptide repeat protein [Acidobacteriota bacterium]